MTGGLKALRIDGQSFRKSVEDGIRIQSGSLFNPNQKRGTMSVRKQKWALVVAVAVLVLGVLAFSVSLRAAKTPETTGVFNRIATFPVILNLCDGNPAPTCLDTTTVSEIVAASEDGKTLIYTDAETGNIGFVDITDPAHPLPGGVLNLGGSPTSVDVAGSYALVTVDNTAGDFLNPTGVLKVIDIPTKSVITTIDLGGQPDAVTVSRNQRYAAITMENQRDEDLDFAPNGQLPAGFLAIVDLVGQPTHWKLRKIDLTGLAAKVGNDPEPENVDINDKGIAVVTLQENNHIVLVDLKNGKLVNHFPAGTVNLTQIDTIDERPNLIDLTSSQSNRLREPDTVAWISDNEFATADEGDLDGGGRGWTIYDTKGNVKWTSGFTFEHLAVRFGHYPDRRSDAQGPNRRALSTPLSNPKVSSSSVANARELWLCIVSSPVRHRSSFRYFHRLPGLKAFSRSLREDCSWPPARTTAGAGHVRASLNIYQLQDEEATYPTILSANRGTGQPIPWGALSGLAPDLQDAGKAYTIYDSFYQKSRIFSLDVSSHPAVITGETELHNATGGTFNFDVEGIATRANGAGFWLVSEGAQNCTAVGTVRPHAFPPESHVQSADSRWRRMAWCSSRFHLPDAVNDRQRSNGFEGVAVVGTPESTNWFM